MDATPLLRAYAAWRARQLARQNPKDVQRQLLLRLVRRAAATRFGREHSFAAIDDRCDFQAAVPLRRYEEFWSAYWRPVFPRLVDCTWPGLIPYFALSSGTSS